MRYLLRNYIHFWMDMLSITKWRSILRIGIKPLSLPHGLARVNCIQQGGGLPPVNTRRVWIGGRKPRSHGGIEVPDILTLKASAVVSPQHLSWNRSVRKNAITATIHWEKESVEIEIGVFSIWPQFLLCIRQAELGEKVFSGKRGGFGAGALDFGSLCCAASEMKDRRWASPCDQYNGPGREAWAGARAQRYRHQGHGRGRYIQGLRTFFEFRPCRDGFYVPFDFHNNALFGYRLILGLCSCDTFRVLGVF